MLGPLPEGVELRKARRARFDFIHAFWILGWIGAAAAVAQEGAVLGLRVVDEAGLPIPSAAVILRPELQGPVELPPPFFTDGDGRVRIERLKAGEWQVEVRSQGYMIFSAYVKLTAGVPPVVGFKSKQRTGTFWAPLEVYFDDVDVDVRMLDPGRGDLEKEQRQALKRAEKESRQATKREAQRAEDAWKAERRAEKRQRQLGRGAEVAVLEEPPAEPPSQVAEAKPPAEPELRSTPVAAPPEDSAPTDVSRPAPSEPVAAELEEASSPAGRPAQPLIVENAEAGVEPASGDREPEAQPTAVAAGPEARETAADRPAPVEIAEVAAPDVPEPAPPVVVAPPVRPPPDVRPPPVAPEPPPPPVVPAVQARPVLLHGGACPECKKGEWALVVERRASISEDGAELCDGDRETRVEAVIDRLLEPQAQLLGAYAGPLADSYGNGVARRLTQAAADPDYTQLVQSDGSCQSFVAILPREARFVGFRFEALDASESGDCFSDRDCGIGEARWTENPRVERTEHSTVIHTSFVNRSRSRERRGRLIVLFVPARGWQPP